MQQNLTEKIKAGERLQAEEAAALWDLDILTLGRLADLMRRRWHPKPMVTYVVDRNLNYTNVCVSGCKFCAFYRPPGNPEGYVMDQATLEEKLAETVTLGGIGVLLQRLECRCIVHVACQHIGRPGQEQRINCQQQPLRAHARFNTPRMLPQHGPFRPLAQLLHLHFYLRLGFGREQVIARTVDADVTPTVMVRRFPAEPVNGLPVKGDHSSCSGLIGGNEPTAIAVLDRRTKQLVRAVPTVTIGEPGRREEVRNIPRLGLSLQVKPVLPQEDRLAVG